MNIYDHKSYNLGYEQGRDELQKLFNRTCDNLENWPGIDKEDYHEGFVDAITDFIAEIDDHTR